MTIQELIAISERTPWFSKLGLFNGHDDTEPLKKLDAFEADVADDIADKMEWLPSTLDQPDPFHDWSRFKSSDKYTGSKAAVMEVYQKTLVSLRSMPDHQLFHVGPHNYANVAKGSALFAFRHAAFEIESEQEGPWIKVVQYYLLGHWPCGLLPNNRLVVM